jgi:DNA-binding transcriptional MerR regulator
MDELSCGEVARACDVSTDTIRYYERRGAIPADRNASGARRFAPSTIRRVRVIRNAIALGFTLDEIIDFFTDRQAGHPPCRKVRAAGEAKLHALDEKIRAMQVLREQVARVLDEWDLRLAQGEPARLLESLPDRART